MRSGTSDGRGNYWGAGANSGTFYFGDGATNTIQTNVPNSIVIQDHWTEISTSARPKSRPASGKLPERQLRPTGAEHLPERRLQSQSVWLCLQLQLHHRLSGGRHAQRDRRHPALGFDRRYVDDDLCFHQPDQHRRPRRGGGFQRRAAASFTRPRRKTARTGSWPSPIPVPVPPSPRSPLRV